MKKPSMREQLRAITNEAPKLAIDSADEAWPKIEEAIYNAAREGRAYITLRAGAHDMEARAKSAALAARAQCHGLTVTRRPNGDDIHWRLAW